MSEREQKQREEREKQIAASVVQKIVSDLTDRKGLRGAWEMVDRDIQAEITEVWEAIVRREVAKV